MAIKPLELIIRAKDQASSVLTGVGAKLTAVAAVVASYFGVSAFVGAVKGASELEAKLSEVKAVSGATAEEMRALRKAAEDAGATTKFTATEAAGALGELARAGFTAKDAIATLPAVLSLAQAGGVDLTRAAEFLTAAITGMGLASKDAGRVADVLAAGANASKTSVTGLAQALSYAAPVAKSLGLGLEFTVGLMGKFADGGIDASRAGTALNAILSQFSDPSSKFRTELSAAGITTSNFEKALRQLAKAGPAGANAINAVGTEAGPALRALLNQGIGSLDELIAKLQNAGGSAAEVAKIMGDNLAGSTKGLASAWDTVKNALTTPVLPVLKQGVDELAKALQEAVSNGTVARFAAALVDGFQSALTWARAFAAEVDFRVLATRMQVFATQTGEVFGKIGEYARNAGNVVQTGYGVMVAGANGVMAAVYLIAEAFTGVVSNILSGVALINDGLAKVTFGAVSARFKAVAEEIRVEAGAMWASSESLGKKANDAFDGMAKGAQTARDGWAGLTDGMRSGERQAQTSAQAMHQVAETLKEVGGDATASGQKAVAAAVAQKEATDKTRAAVALLRAEYQAALNNGNWQLAVEKIREVERALHGAADAAVGASEKAKEVAEAYLALGIKSQESLKTAAAANKVYFERIVNDAKATKVDIANAFIAMAKSVIDANAGVVPEWLKTQAAIRGVTLEVDQTGKVTLEVSNRITGATTQIADGWRGVGAAARQAGIDGMVSAEQMAEAAKKVAEINARYAAPTGTSIVGATREERLAGQGSLDLSNQFDIRAKLRDGTLTKADLPEAQAVLKQLDVNEAVNRTLDQINPSSASLTGLQDRQEWAAVRALLSQTISALGGDGQGGTRARQVVVQLQGRDGLSSNVPTTEAGAAALINALQQDQRRAG